MTLSSTSTIHSITEDFIQLWKTSGRVSIEKKPFSCCLWDGSGIVINFHLIAPLSAPKIFLVCGIKTIRLISLQLVAGNLPRPLTGLAARIIDSSHIIGKFIV
jgi:hypothetical protein